MANFSELKKRITTYIKANGNQEITGQILQTQLIDMVTEFGDGYQFAGIATQATNPNKPDHKVFYLAQTPGIFTGFGKTERINEFGWAMFTSNDDDAWDYTQVVTYANDINESGEQETWGRPVTLSSVATAISQTAITTCPFINKIIKGLFVDKEGYTGTLDITQLAIGDIWKNDNGTYGFNIVNGTDDVIAHISKNSVTDSTVKGLYKDKNGADIYVNCYLDWTNLGDGVYRMSEIIDKYPGLPGLKEICFFKPALQRISGAEGLSIVPQQIQTIRKDIKDINDKIGALPLGVEPDNEDLTSTKNPDGESIMKFADRKYDAANFSGKGYKILRKNIVDGKNVLTQEMVNEPNTIYNVRYDYSLNEGTVTIPDGCTVNFIGGSINNGSIVFTDTFVCGDVRIGAEQDGTTTTKTVVEDTTTGLFSKIKKMSTFPFAIGQIIETTGTITAHDGGHARYKVNKYKDSNESRDTGFFYLKVPLFKVELELIIDGKVNAIDVGAVPNSMTEDLADVINNYCEELKYRDDVFELYIPQGVYCCSAVKIYNHKHERNGVHITGQSPQVGRDKESCTRIIALNNNQDYIWKIGKSEEDDKSHALTANNTICNICFSTGNPYDGGITDHEKCRYHVNIAALYIDGACYSHFDGIYFHYLNGTGLAIRHCWENYFGYLNFRGVGWYQNGKVFSAMVFRGHPYGPNCSAHYFDYINFEGYVGSCIESEENSQLTHCDFNVIQVEDTSWPTATFEGSSSMVEGESVSEPGGQTSESVRSYMLDPEVEHHAVFKGIVYNTPITFNTICKSKTTRYYEYKYGDKTKKILRCAIFTPMNYTANKILGGSICVGKVWGAPIVDGGNGVYDGSNKCTLTISYGSMGVGDNNLEKNVSSKTSWVQQYFYPVFTGQSNGLREMSAISFEGGIYAAANGSPAYTDLDSKHPYCLCLCGLNGENVSTSTISFDATRKYVVRVKVLSARLDKDSMGNIVYPDINLNVTTTFVNTNQGYICASCRASSTQFEDGTYPLDVFFYLPIVINTNQLSKVDYFNNVSTLSVGGRNKSLLIDFIRCTDVNVPLQFTKGDMNNLLFKNAPLGTRLYVKDLDGITPAGNPIRGLWVISKGDGTYRNDWGDDIV